MPAMIFLALTAFILAISVWAMVTQESDPTFSGESGYDVFADSSDPGRTESLPPIARGA
jgi:hypothetical protein